MRKKYILYSLCFILLFFIEAVIRPVTVFGVAPMYVLCGVTAIGVLENARAGSIFGLIFGLFCDFASGSAFGSQAISFMIVGIIAGIVVESTLSPSVFSSILVTESSVIVFGVLKALFNEILNEGPQLWSALRYIIFPKAMLTLPFTVVIYFLMKLISNQSTIKRERIRKNSW